MAQINIMLDEPHTAIPRPATPVVVASNIVVHGAQVSTEVALDKVVLPRLRPMLSQKIGS